jgi:hypothetical protein
VGAFRRAEAHERLRSLSADPVLGSLVRTLLSLAAGPGKTLQKGGDSHITSTRKN